MAAVNNNDVSVQLGALTEAKGQLEKAASEFDAARAEYETVRNPPRGSVPSVPPPTVGAILQRESESLGRAADKYTALVAARGCADAALRSAFGLIRSLGRSQADNVRLLFDGHQQLHALRDGVDAALGSASRYP